MFLNSQAMYERMFCWIVSRINDIIQVKNYNANIHGKNTVIGVLDIYGFEIFQNNRWATAPVKTHQISITFPNTELAGIHLNVF